MRVFLFPDLVFPCWLILPLSGVSAQVSSQHIGPDWDGRNCWSTLTCSPMIFLFFFFRVIVQTEKRMWLFWSVRADTHSGVCRLLLRSKGKFHPWGAEVLHLSCYSNIAKQLIRHWQQRSRNSYITSEISPHSLCSETFRERHTGALLTPRGIYGLVSSRFLINICSSARHFLHFHAHTVSVQRFPSCTDDKPCCKPHLCVVTTACVCGKEGVCVPHWLAVMQQSLGRVNDHSVYRDLIATQKPAHILRLSAASEQPGVNILLPETHCLSFSFSFSLPLPPLS